MEVHYSWVETDRAGCECTSNKQRLSLILGLSFSKEFERGGGPCRIGWIPSRRFFSQVKPFLYASYVPCKRLVHTTIIHNVLAVVLFSATDPNIVHFLCLRLVDSVLLNVLFLVSYVKHSCVEKFFC